MAFATKRDQVVAEVVSLTDEQVAARIIDSMQTIGGLTGMLGAVSRWVGYIREAERTKSEKGAAIGRTMEASDEQK